MTTDHKSRARAANGAGKRVGEEQIFDGRVVSDLRTVVISALRRVIGGNDPDYEDVVQTALERLLGAIRDGSFRGEGHVAGWALAIARNVAIDRVRARCRERRVFAQGDELESAVGRWSSVVGPDRLADARHQLEAFMDALSRLGDRKAEVVYLHDVLGYGLAEIATAAGISVAAAQSRLVRGRNEVASEMLSALKGRSRKSSARSASASGRRRNRTRDPIQEPPAAPRKADRAAERPRPGPRPRGTMARHERPFAGDVAGFCCGGRERLRRW